MDEKWTSGNELKYLKQVLGNETKSNPFTDRLEKAFCEVWKNLIWEENSLLKVRYNYPYLGSADGFATYLRKQFPEYYIGIELEVNQKWVKNNAFDESIKTSLINSINRLYSKN